MIAENHIEVTRTARYYTYGNLSETTKQVWFVCHGYGQPAASMIKHFKVLNPDKHYVVAPEALSRFYWNGFNGEIVASWMTSEDRENEIRDYVHYLNDLYEQIMSQINQPIHINVLGFSQGATTVSRWVGAGKVAVNRLVLWAGLIAEDLNLKTALPIFQKADIFFVYGTKDPYIKGEYLEKAETMMQEYKLKYQTLTFEGKHEIHRPTISNNFSE
ncbi:MAG: alpha/beta hydrolase [Chitinophagales bacterium]